MTSRPLLPPRSPSSSLALLTVPSSHHRSETPVSLPPPSTPPLFVLPSVRITPSQSDSNITPYTKGNRIYPCVASAVSHTRRNQKAERLSQRLPGIKRKHTEDPSDRRTKRLQSEATSPVPNQTLEPVPEPLLQLGPSPDLPSPLRPIAFPPAPPQWSDKTQTGDRLHRSNDLNAQPTGTQDLAPTPVDEPPSLQTVNPTPSVSDNVIPCVECSQRCTNIRRHWKTRHKEVRRNARALATMGLIPCERCGVAVQSRHGMRCHWSKTNCSPGNTGLSATEIALPAPAPSPQEVFRPDSETLGTPSTFSTISGTPITTMLLEAETAHISQQSQTYRASTPHQHADTDSILSLAPSAPLSTDGSFRCFRPEDLALQTLLSYHNVTPLYRLPRGTIRSLFIDAAERVALAFSSQPSEENLLNFLLLPKAGLSLARSLPGGRAQEILRTYPMERLEAPVVITGQPKNRNQPWNQQTSDTDPTAARAQKLLEKGFLRRAARALSEPASLAPSSVETFAQLKTKHPVGEPSPFASSANPRVGPLPTANDVNSALQSFARDTAPGISGWNMPLLMEAATRPGVMQMLVLLCRMFQLGTLPGKQLLLVSRLIALDKPEGGVRPIAVGELVYRLMAKVALSKSFAPRQLAPFQLGVKSAGGVACTKFRPQLSQRASFLQSQGDN